MDYKKTVKLTVRQLGTVREIKVLGWDLTGIPATAYSCQQREAVLTWLSEYIIWVTPIWAVTVKML